MAGISDSQLEKMTQEERVKALGMATEQLSGRSLFIEFNADEEGRFTYPWAPDVDFNKRTEINADNMTSTALNKKNAKYFKIPSLIFAHTVMILK